MMSTALLPTQYLLYGDDGYDSHIVRFCLEEKGLEYRFVASASDDDELAWLNPYKTLPILVGKELSLYEPNIIMEYLDERHPSVRLLPATPKERAMVRTLLWRIQKDWLSFGRILLTHPDSFDEKKAIHAKKTLSDTLITLSPLFAKKEFFLSDELGICDIWLVPFLYRLPQMGIELPIRLCRPVYDYFARLSQRIAFQKTLIS